MPLVETRYGQFAVPENTDDLIGQFLTRYGEWAWDEVAFVASNLAPGARVLDVGAYLGTFGLGLSLRQHIASVCYVEANPNVTPLLRENIRRLKRQPSQVVAALAYAGGDPPDMAHIDEANWGGLSFAPNSSGALFTQQPESYVTLAELRELYGPFDLIKLDVEGMERELIESDADFFRSGRCHLWLECNERSTSMELVDILLGFNLDIFYFAFPSYNPDNYHNDADTILPFAFEAGLLAGQNLAPKLDASLHAHGCILRPIRSSEDLRQALWRTPRWGLKDWEGQSASEVAALAGRILVGQEYSTFIEKGGADWNGAFALVDELRRKEAQLRAHQAALEDEFAGDHEKVIYSLVEREGALRAEIQAQQESYQTLKGEICELRHLLDQRNGELRSLSARLSEIRATASERLFQLSMLATRVKDVEVAAADAQVRLLESAQQHTQESEAFIATERQLRKELASVIATEQQLRKELASVEKRGWFRRPIKDRSIYRKIVRPFVKELRRLFSFKRKLQAK